MSVRVGGKRGLVDAEPAPHRPEGTVGPFREGCRERPAAYVIFRSSLQQTFPEGQIMQEAKALLDALGSSNRDGTSMS